MPAFLRVFAIVVLLAICPLAAAAPAAGPAAPVPGPPAADIAWTARILLPVVARSAPRADAKVVAKVSPYTAFWARAQRLLVVSTVQTDPATGRSWIRVRLPSRPNESAGFVPVDAVQLRATRWRIVVRVHARAVELWHKGARVARFRAAVGTGSTPTPQGLFAVQDPVPSAAYQRSYLGPYIITLTAHSDVLHSFMGGDGLVAIHGTNETGLLGQAVSHGCIRISNGAVSRLYKVTQPGTPVQIIG